MKNINFDNKNENSLLRMLPGEHFLHIIEKMELVNLIAGSCMDEQTQSAAYFPSTAVIEMSYTLTNNQSSVISYIGKEGMVGVVSFMGGTSLREHLTVKSSGFAYRLPAGDLKSEFLQQTKFSSILLQYVQFIMVKMSQNIICSRNHTHTQQICRHLLEQLDLNQGCAISMTQQSIASNIGVRRERVTEIATNLQKLGLIRYSRGSIHVLNVDELENISCDCHRINESEYTYLFQSMH